MAGDSRSVAQRHFHTALLALAIVVVGGVMWALIEQNLTLKASLRTSQGRPPESGLVSGLKLPDLPLVSLTGEASSLTEVLGGKTAVVGFMTTTCPSCQANLPQWDSLRAHLAEHGTRFLALSFDDEQASRTYRAEHRIEWPMWGIPRSAAALLPKTLVPTTLVVDREGVVLRSKTGVLSDLDREELLSAVGPR